MIQTLVKMMFWRKKRIFLILVLLFFGAKTPILGSCLNLARPLLETRAEDTSSAWKKFNDLFGNDFVQVDTTALEADEVSLDNQIAMHLLTADGGRGRYEHVKYGIPANERSFHAVRVISPPQGSIYGSAFGEVFNELDAQGIPVFINPDLAEKGLGGQFSTMKFSSDTKVIFEIGPRGGNIASRHELQHARDLFINFVEFAQTLPEPPPAMIRLLERREAGEVLEKQDIETFEAMLNLIIGLAEVRASESSLASLFTFKGLREIVATKTWAFEMKMYRQELVNAFVANRQLLENLRQNNLFYSSSGLIVASKGVIFSIIPLAILGGGVYLITKIVIENFN